MIDLHCHSTVSDGMLPPREVVRLAHANGCTLLALTDHDHTGGLAEARAEAAALGMGFGVLTSYGEHSNWIILIFPFVCAAAVYQDPQMWKLLMAVGESIALCALLRTFVRYWQYGATLMEYPVTLIVYSVFMLGLCGIGCLIGWLLNYAKESTHENKE